MSLSQALISAISGLKANQSSLALVSANVANAGTAGYVRKTVNQVAVAGSGTGIGVRISAIQRELDTYVQRQLRVENSGAAYATTRSQFYNQLQAVYGTPGSDAALETVFNKFSDGAAGAVEQSGRHCGASLGRQHRAIADAAAQHDEHRHSGSARRTRNSAFPTRSARPTTRCSRSPRSTRRSRRRRTSMSAAVTMYDQRDAYIDKLSKLMDINVIAGDNNQLAIYTNSGIQLVGTRPRRSSFDAQGTMSATTQWSADPNVRGGRHAFTLTSANGSKVDLIQTNAIRSGQIAAYLQMRDQDLVQAQTPARCYRRRHGERAVRQDHDRHRRDVRPAERLRYRHRRPVAGNKITINYTNSLTNTPRTITLIRVDDPSVLPLSDNVTASANDKVYGIDFSGGMSAVYGQIASAHRLDRHGGLQSVRHDAARAQ